MEAERTQGDETLLPVVRLNVAALESHGMVIVRLDVLTHPDADPLPGRRHALFPSKARELAKLLLEQAAALDGQTPAV